MHGGKGQHVAQRVPVAVFAVMECVRGSAFVGKEHFSGFVATCENA